MKRKPTNKNEVSRYYSLFFWRECQFCKQEFRRENGYKWPCWNFYNYACATCVASVSHCDDTIEWRKQTAIAKLTGCIPHPPPMRTLNNTRQPLWTD